MNINIGGGRFDHPGWLNLDAVTGYKLSPSTMFPVEDHSAQIIYSSHCFEHLDDATVSRMLAESRRALRSRGWLALKIPDFQDVLLRYKAGDHAYFKQWGMEKLVHMWPEDSIHARAAMIFCGHWNDAYGDEFNGERRPDAPGAYHGPMYDMLANSALADCSPHQISSFFRDLTISLKPGVHFNHQNAWSAPELRELLERHGFQVLSIDPDEMCKLPIPGVESQRAISLYMLASSGRR